jgi:hypothetical protein
MLCANFAMHEGKFLYPYVIQVDTRVSCISLEPMVANENHSFTHMSF